MAGPDDKQRTEDDDGRSDLARAYQKAGPYMAASTQLVAAVGLGTWVGWWGDQKLHHDVPWMLLTGAGLGMLGGFVSFFRTVLGKGKGK
ncbi:MAG TPA: AtpZ/AtpI family protein [Anaeromyxobacteraceae bacterium]|nr:AtpZ/AtpI family protein [Anaeromyxobacteraceae bacterium]